MNCCHCGESVEEVYISNGGRFFCDSCTDKHLLSKEDNGIPEGVCTLNPYNVEEWRTSEDYRNMIKANAAREHGEKLAELLLMGEGKIATLRTKTKTLESIVELEDAPQNCGLYRIETELL